ncbi:hypothetical protein [Methanonatronarchaeum sp. AMET6-2]|uniref:hypothetical protein n=1 Tax=Methanonatronarchaeum sp. AMET6-2 TaxID=2933293 RepID=UPI001FF2794D|nr:hypothetical protein [Methanonatronarchaeum sp. AMET6-2]UOY09378.1 hypothetical protein MU439_03745 [Methanonatronarchaeum sp. AMET6-2]
MSRKIKKVESVFVKIPGYIGFVILFSFLLFFYEFEEGLEAFVYLFHCLLCYLRRQFLVVLVVFDSVVGVVVVEVFSVVEEVLPEFLEMLVVEVL